MCGCGKPVHKRFVRGHHMRILSRTVTKKEASQRYGWCKGLTKETDLRLVGMARTRSRTMKGRVSHLKGKTYEEIYGRARARKLRKLRQIKLLGIVRPKGKDSPHYGPKSPNWNGGVSKEGYSHLFTKQLKDRIRKRDGYACQNCNVGFSLLKKKPRTLDVHHIDYDKSNCEECNLITLCNKCNLLANIDRDYWYALYAYKIALRLA